MHNNPIRYKDPTGHWKDESKEVVYKDQGVPHQAELNKGTVTKDDTLVKLAEKQLTKEKGTSRISKKDVENKVEAIKTANNLKSDVLKIGQKLTLGLSKDRVADWNVAKEDGVEKRDGESLAAALAIVAAGKIAADTASVAATTKTGQIMMTAAKELTKKAINWALANPIKTFVGGKIIKGAIDPNPATDPLEATGAVTRKGLEKGAEKIEKLINNSDETKRK